MTSSKKGCILSSNRLGFTLLEMMIVVSIISILAGIAVTSYKSHIRKAHETATKNDLARIRAALVLYRSIEGIYPDNLSRLVTTTYQDGGVSLSYLDGIPTAKPDGCPASAAVIRFGYPVGTNNCDDNPCNERCNAAGGWIYCYNRGKVYISCCSPASSNTPPCSAW